MNTKDAKTTDEGKSVKGVFHSDRFKGAVVPAILGAIFAAVPTALVSVGGYIIYVHDTRDMVGDVTEEHAEYVKSNDSVVKGVQRDIKQLHASLDEFRREFTGDIHEIEIVLAKEGIYFAMANPDQSELSPASVSKLRKLAPTEITSVAAYLTTVPSAQAVSIEDASGSSEAAREVKRIVREHNINQEDLKGYWKAAQGLAFQPVQP